MNPTILRLVSASIALAACAGRQSPQTNPKARAFLDAAFACAVSAVEGGGYRVSKDDRTLAVHGFIREELSADPASLGGPVGGEGARRNAGDVAAPYEVDGIDAKVSLGHDGDVKIEAEAYTGMGASSKSGYTKRPASPRGASTLKRVQDCAP